MNFLTLICFVFLTFTFVKNSYDHNNEIVGFYEGLFTTLSESVVYPQQVTQINQRESQDHQSFIPAYYQFSINSNNDLIQHDRQQIPSFDELNETGNGLKPRLYQRKSSKNLQYLTNTTPKKSESTYTTSEDLDSKYATEKILSQDICHTYVHKSESHTDDKENVALQKALFSQELEKNTTTLNVYAKEFLPKGSAILKYDDKLSKEHNSNYLENQSTYLQSDLETQLSSPSSLSAIIDMASNLEIGNHEYLTDDEFCNSEINVDLQETSDLVDGMEKLSLLQNNPNQIDLHPVPKKDIKYGCRNIKSESSQLVNNKPELQSNRHNSSKVYLNRNMKKQKNLQPDDPDTEIQKPIYSKSLYKSQKPKFFFIRIISHQLKYALKNTPSKDFILYIIDIINSGPLDFFNKVLFIILLSYTKKGFINYRDFIIEKQTINLLTDYKNNALYSTLSIRNAMVLFQSFNLKYYNIKEGYDILIKKFTGFYSEKNIPNYEKYLLGFKKHSFFCLNSIFE